jgi:hypothetical protein
MNVILFIVLVLLFVVLTPGVALSLPPKGSKLVVALTHGLVFALIWTLIKNPIYRLTSRMGFSGMEGMKEGNEDEELDEEGNKKKKKEGMYNEMKKNK